MAFGRICPTDYIVGVAGHGSGLRLAESLELFWDREDRLYPVFPKSGRPMLQIPGELEKGHADRTGPVFPWVGRGPQKGRPLARAVGGILSEIGEKAGVRVHVDPKDPKKVKCASAHDLRRAFGVRWAARLMPAQLMELRRHESIETTLRFYVGTDAQAKADAAWEAFERAGGAFSEAAPNKARNRELSAAAAAKGESSNVA